jgi:PAS domain S-box-containing protein
VTPLELPVSRKVRLALASTAVTLLIVSMVLYRGVVVREGGLVVGAVCGFLIATAVAWSGERDRGKRSQIERELITARDWLRHVVSSSPTVLYTLNVIGGTHSPAWVSENSESVIGYRSDEVSDGTWWETHVHPEDRDRLLLEVPELLAKGHIEREYRLRRKDGTYAWVQDEQRLLRDPAGNPNEVIGSWSDVTVRKNAERRLLESEEEYRVLFDSNPHPMWVFDSETLAFLEVNDAAVRLYGFSRSEFLGMTIEAIRPETEVPALLAYLAVIPDDPSLLATQVKHRKKDGSLLEVEGVSKYSSSNRKKWRPSVASPAVSPTTSTTSWA